MVSTTLQPDGEFEEEPRSSRIPAWLAESPWWAASVLVHAIALVLFAVLIVGTVEPPEEETRTIVRREMRPPPYNPRLIRDPERKPQVLSEKTEKLIKPTIEPIAPPKGKSLEAKTQTASENEAAHIEVGLAGGPGGDYGLRNGTGAAVAQEGWSRASESAVLAALHWLARHQHPDGYWSSNAFTEQCRSGTCTSRSDQPHGNHGLGAEGYDVGLTGLAMLAFLGYGHTHQTGKHREFVMVVRKACRWLIKQQLRSDDPTKDGVYGPTEGESWTYNHAIATMAMSELLGMSYDRRLKRSVEAATEWILRAQNPGLGWKYGYQDAENDSSVTGWMVLALKGSRIAAQQRLLQIDTERFDQSFDGALTWFERVTGTQSGITGYDSPGDGGSSLDIYGEPYPFAKDRLRCMTAVSVWCRILAGQKRSQEVRRGVEVLMQDLPEWRPSRGKVKSTINLYHWYYASNAMFQYGGPKWKRWNTAMQDALISNQRQGDREGDEDGSWDPVGEWGSAGGRVYATAIGALTLEVYYRYRRLSENSIPAESPAFRRPAPPPKLDVIHQYACVSLVALGSKLRTLASKASFPTAFQARQVVMASVLG